MSGVWPAPIGTEAQDALDRAEQIRAKLMEIAQWAQDEWSANNFEQKIVAGMVSQGRVRDEAAQAVARNLVQLLRRLNDSCLDGAASAKVFAEKVRTLYIEPIEENRRQTPRPAMGLKVN